MDRSDLVRDLRNGAWNDCLNPFRNELHMKAKHKVNHGDINRQIEKIGRQITCNTI